MSLILRPETQTLILAATQTKQAATNVYEDVPTFSLPVMGNTVYKFEFDVIFQTPNTNRGIGLSVNGPTSPNFVLIRTSIPTSLTAVSHGMARAYNTGASTTASDASTSNCLAQCFGYLSTGSAAGNLSLAFVTNNTGSAVQIMAGSIMRLYRISPSN